MAKLKQCAICEGHYDNSMLMGIMDTYICDVCVLDVEKLIQKDLGNTYKKGLPKTSTRQLHEGKPLFTISSPIHPKPDLTPTTA